MAVRLRRSRKGGEEADYLEADLSEDGWVCRQLGLLGFARQGCPRLGTRDCIQCSLVSCIPRQGCNPPDECKGCEERERCPCGSEARRQELLRER